MPLAQLGPYKIGERLGRGGMGTVYAAENVETGQRVAVKVLAESLAQEEGFRDRFAAEIESLRQLRHPNIVELYGFGEQDGTLFYAMELVAGPSLEEVLRGGREFGWLEAADVAIQVCKALKHAHDRGVVHRDIKPANLLCPPNGAIKLSDFGISKLFGASGMTAEGGLLGTAEYMAPEQADGSPVTHRCDLYSLGGVIYTMLAKRPPFQAKSIVEMLQLQRFAEPEPVRRFAPTIPVELEEIVGKLLQKKPDDRVATATALLRRLESMRLGLAVRPSPNEDETRLSNPAHPNPVPPNPVAPKSESATPGNPSETTAHSGDGQRAKDEDGPSTSPGAVRGDTGETQAGEEYVIAEPAAPGSASDAFRASRANFNLANDLAQGDQSKAPAHDTNPGGGLELAPSGKPNPNLPSPGASIAAGRYTAVDRESAPWRDLISDHPSPWKSPQTWALIVCVAAMAYATWRFLGPASADELFGRISAAVTTGDDEKLLAVSDDVDSFVARFPEDDRHAEVQTQQQRLSEIRTQRRLDLRARSGARDGNRTPIDEAYADALHIAEFDADEALRRFDALVDLFGGAKVSAEVQQTIEAARSQAVRLRTRAMDMATRRMALLEEVLTRADRLARDDVGAARKLWLGVIELYESKSWATKLVERARRGLQDHPTGKAP